MKRVALFSAALIAATMPVVANAEPVRTEINQSVCFPVLIQISETEVVEALLCFEVEGGL